MSEPKKYLRMPQVKRRETVPRPLRRLSTSPRPFTVLVLHPYKGLMWGRFVRRIMRLVDYLLPATAGYLITHEPPEDMSGYDAIVAWKASMNLVPITHEHKTVIVPSVASRRPVRWRVDCEAHYIAKGFILTKFNASQYGDHA
jgi:hypothetical protein